MSTLVERLRGIVAAVPGATSARTQAVDAGSETEVVPGFGGNERTSDVVSGFSRTGSQPSAHQGHDAAEILGGTWRESGGHRFLEIDRTYRPGHRHGRLTLVDCLLPERGTWCDVLVTPPREGRQRSRDGAGRRPEGVPGRALFVDLETTGLAGGAGTHAFLIGCAWFEGCILRVRQLFMSSVASERALLEALADLAGASQLVVSYNGKSFDLPLIETRYLFNRMEPPFAGLPHLDMLHPARRLWRAVHEDGSSGPAPGCRLGTVEQTVCGHTREGDVPGFDIPSRYFHYVRTGDPRPLEGVLEHNRLDLLSLVFLTSRAAQLVEDGPASARTAREAVGLGRLYDRGGFSRKARASFARGCGLDGSRALAGDTPTLVDALRAYAVICRRERQYSDAAVAWRRLVELPRCPPPIFREATEALAMHHEHRLRDPGAARTFALRSLPVQGSPSRTQALQHRLARLDRKLMDLAHQPAALF